MTELTTAQKLRAQTQREAAQQVALAGRRPVQAHVEATDNQAPQANDGNNEEEEQMDPEEVQRLIQEEERQLLEQRDIDVANHKKNIYYSNYYWGDDGYGYRHCKLPNQIARWLPSYDPLPEKEWRALGVDIPSGWEHYMVHAPEPQVLLFRKEIKAAEQEVRQKQKEFREEERRRAAARAKSRVKNEERRPDDADQSKQAPKEVNEAGESNPAKDDAKEVVEDAKETNETTQPTRMTRAATLRKRKP